MSIEFSKGILQNSNLIDERRDSSMDSAYIMNYENNDIILPDSTELDWSQITYAINYKRIIFIHNYKTWSNFHTENGSQYNDYTPEELCHRFLKRILPNIYDYELSEDELHLLSLLEIHPCYDRTDSGFNFMEQIECTTFPTNEAAIESLLADRNPFNGINFVGGYVESNHQILTREHSNIQRKFNLSAENAALLSVVLCTNEDLPSCELLTVEEMYNRLKAANSRFQNNGEQLENINISITVLLDKLQTLNRLKQTITKLVDTNFHSRNEI